ncbi:MAG: RQC domain-containing protein [Candidatus Helarchaeota archaeon]
MAITTNSYNILPGQVLVVYLFNTITSVICLNESPGYLEVITLKNTGKLTIRKGRLRRILPLIATPQNLKDFQNYLMHLEEEYGLNRTWDQIFPAELCESESYRNLMYYLRLLKDRLTESSNFQKLFLKINLQIESAILSHKKNEMRRKEAQELIESNLQLVKEEYKKYELQLRKKLEIQRKKELTLMKKKFVALKRKFSHINKKLISMKTELSSMNKAVESWFTPTYDQLALKLSAEIESLEHTILEFDPSKFNSLADFELRTDNIHSQFVTIQSNFAHIKEQFAQDQKLGEIILKPTYLILKTVEYLPLELGITTLKKVLQGSNDKRILVHDLQDIPYYGKLAHLTQAQIQEFIEDAISQGLLYQDYREIRTVFTRFQMPLLDLTDLGTEAVNHFQRIFQADNEFLHDFYSKIAKYGSLELILKCYQSLKPEEKPVFFELLLETSNLDALKKILISGKRNEFKTNIKIFSDKLQASFIPFLITFLLLDNATVKFPKYKQQAVFRLLLKYAEKHTSDPVKPLLKGLAGSLPQPFKQIIMKLS